MVEFLLEHPADHDHAQIAQIRRVATIVSKSNIMSIWQWLRPYFSLFITICRLQLSYDVETFQISTIATTVGRQPSEAASLTTRILQSASYWLESSPRKGPRRWRTWPIFARESIGRYAHIPRYILQFGVTTSSTAKLLMATPMTRSSSSSLIQLV